MKFSFPKKLLVAVIFPTLFLNCDKNAKDDGDSASNKPQPNKSMQISILAKNLKHPWGLGYLPNGDLLFTERPGQVNLLKKGNENYSLLTTRPIQEHGEGGLLGLAVDPDFNNNHYIFLYETAESNRVVRCKFENGQFTEDKIIIQGIPKATYHDGGAIQFGPDGYLYIGTGDAGKPEIAQNKSSNAGKILRTDRDGNPAPGNPFNTLIWSYGHRNVQGLTWTSSGKMYATEHGPSGELGWCCHDELNLIEAGKNYGWPMVIGDTESDTLVKPLAHSGQDTWAPSGCAATRDEGIWPGQIVTACLRGSKLIRFGLEPSGAAVSGQSDTLTGTYGRLRNIINGPDGSLVFCTSNGDDQIYKISVK